MTRRTLAYAAPLALAAAFGVTAAAQPTTSIAFTGVTVVPMDSTRLLSNHTVVVTGASRPSVLPDRRAFPRARSGSTGRASS